MVSDVWKYEMTLREEVWKPEEVFYIKLQLLNASFHNVKKSKGNKTQLFNSYFSLDCIANAFLITNNSIPVNKKTRQVNNKR